MTLSVEQKALAEERVKAAGLEGKIRVHLMDYREIPPEFEKAFDAFISIEMLEVNQNPVTLMNIHIDYLNPSLQHVGAKHYNTYFKLVDFALKSRDATAVVSASTFPESRYTGYQYALSLSMLISKAELYFAYRSEDFMRRYMWPNSCLPSATALITAAQTASNGRFTLEGVENHAARKSYSSILWVLIGS